MATNTVGQQAQQYHTRQSHYLVQKLVFGDDAVQKNFGGKYLPAGSIVINCEILVKTAFNDGGTDFVTVGTAADPDGFLDDVSVATVGLKRDETTLDASDDRVILADTEVVCQYDGASSNMTAGLAYVFIEYIVDPAAIDA